ncbi:MAG TPA: hypothetical protein VK281_08120 [Xanthobacteraceae bacterium]|nr:hypothetical protein [Xanthobacteraceae bacterium]
MADLEPRAADGAAAAALRRAPAARSRPGSGGFVSDLRGAAGAIALAVSVVVLLQPMFVVALVAARHLADVDAVATTVRSAFGAGVLADDEVPSAWINRGGHQFTECVALNVALDAQDDLQKSALLPQLHFQMRSSCAELHRLVAGDATDDTMDYSRYWHGYRIYLWPMLAHLDLQQVRTLNACLVLIAAAVFFVGLRAAIGVTPAAIFCVVFLGLTDLWRIWVITTHALSMEMILAGAGLFALVFKRTRSPAVAVVLAAILGALFNFVDFLVNPPLMPMLLGFIVMAVAGAPARRRSDPKAGLSAGVLAVASWFGGYGLTWGSKWMLATWLSADPTRTMAGIANQIAFRLNGLEEGSRMFRIPLVPTLEMIMTSLVSIGIIPVAAMATLIVLHARDPRSGFHRARFIGLIWPTSISFVWFELLSNHTQLHPHFVYRSAAAAIAIVLTALVMASDAPFSPAWGMLALRSRLRPRPLRAPASEPRSAVLVRAHRGAAATGVKDGPRPRPAPAEIAAGRARSSRSVTH